MAKCTRKQQLAQQASERQARKHVSETRKQVKVIRAAKTTSQPLQTLGDKADSCKTNLLIRNSTTGEPLLMRVSPTSLYKQGKAKKEASKGHTLFQELKKLIPDRSTRGTFKLGIYHTVGHSYLGFTLDTKGSKTRQEAAELLKWARDYSKDFLLVTRILLPLEWQEDWLQSIFQRQVNLLSPWWTTVTFFFFFFFDGFTGDAHTDNSDHPPSFLFNFGAPCYVVLHNYNIRVQVDPLDIIIFNAHTVRHSMEAIPGQHGER